MASNSAVKKVVTVIPIKPVEMIKGLPENSKRRVYAYCRVSADNVAQESSFESQVTYYTNYINSKSDWTMIYVYADEQ
jgi:predicted site-specific integrase-resolvase